MINRFISLKVQKMKINMGDYDFLDLGAGDGGSIGYAKKRFNAKRGIGIDIDPEKVKMAKEKGHDVILGDVTKMHEMQKSVKFVIMSHFLEHLEGFNMAEKVLKSAVDIAQDFIYIKQPFFDSDSYLFKKGFMHMWAYWYGHDFHMTSFDFYRILMPLKLQSKIEGFIISGYNPTVTSDDPLIHPLKSGSGQSNYDPKIHPPKGKNIIFNNVFKELEVFISIKDNAADKYYPQSTRMGKVIFDSNNTLPLIHGNVRTPDSGTVGKILAGREIKQMINYSS